MALANGCTLLPLRAKILKNGYLTSLGNLLSLYYQTWVIHMRPLKDKTYKAVLDAARGEFLLHGYKNASMRTIARRAGVGTSNLYNYFEGKDRIFRAIVTPVRNRLFSFIAEQHSKERVSCSRIAPFGHDMEVVEKYIDLVWTCREEIWLLLYGADGSSESGFRDALTDHITRVSHEYQKLEITYFHRTKSVSPFFIHIMAAWTVSVLGEIVTHRLDRPRIREFFREFFQFEYAGWMALTEPRRA